MVNEIKKPVLLTLVLLIICGLAYPVLMTGLSQAIFPEKANGSLIEVNGHAVGSKLVGQAFTDARFMKCRPSAYNYNTYTQADKDSGSYAGVASGSQICSRRPVPDLNRISAPLPQRFKFRPWPRPQDCQKSVWKLL